MTADLLVLRRLPFQEWLQIYQSLAIICQFFRFYNCIYRSNNKMNKNAKVLQQLQVGGVMPISLYQSTYLHGKSSNVDVEAEAILTKRRSELKLSKITWSHLEYSHKKRKDSLEVSLDRVLLAAELEFPKILVPSLSQHASNVNIECVGKSEWSKKLYSLYVTSFLEHWCILILLFWY